MKKIVKYQCEEGHTVDIRREATKLCGPVVKDVLSFREDDGYELFGGICGSCKSAEKRYLLHKYSDFIDGEFKKMYVCDFKLVSGGD